MNETKKGKSILERFYVHLKDDLNLILLKGGLENEKTS